MQPRVIAIVVARDDGTRIEQTLAALRAQSRQPDEIVLVDAGSSDGSGERMAATGRPVDRLPTLPFGAAVERAVRTLPPDAGDWLWLLPGDAVAEPDALARLLGAVERSPSVAMAGPKLVAADDPTLLRSFGESLSRFGATVPLAEDELDQAQHDRQDDVLGVALPGSLVRRALWAHLGGADPGLPTADAGLDLAIRARLAGARVVRVPDARIAIERRPDEFGRRRGRSAGSRHREARRAELHRRLVTVPAIAVPFLWLALVPLGILRALGALLAKRPALAVPEIAAAVQAAFDGSVPRARRRFRRTRKLPWTALAPLRVPPEVVRERRLALRDRSGAPAPDLVRAAFLPGGLAAVAIAAVVGIAMAAPLIGAAVVGGGATLPLSDDPATLWSRLGWGERDALGTTGPADPFAWVLALLGSLAFWQPSSALVALWLAAPGLSALGAWWAATRLSSRSWPPAVAALAWGLAPPLLAALADGRPAAVLVHVLLPWLVLAALGAVRSWSAAGAASLLFAAVAACSPILVPALLAGVIALAAVRPRGMVRTLGIPIVALVLAAPLIVAQLRRGTPLGLLADPGPQVAAPAPSGWSLLLGIPSGATPGWEVFGLTGDLATVLPAALLVPLAALGLLAFVLPGWLRAVPAAAVLLAGLATAVVAAHLGVTLDGPDVVTPWPGAPLSLYWAGLVGVAVLGLDALRRVAPVPGVLAAAAAAGAVAPLAVAPLLGLAAVHADDGRQLPALVEAEGARRPGTGTLVLSPHADGSLGVATVRGAGPTLDGTSTYLATARTPTAAEREVAELAVDLVSQGGADAATALQRRSIEFIVLPEGGATDGGAVSALRQRAAEGLDAAPDLQPIGDTGFGALWRAADDVAPAAVAAPPAWAPALLGVQGAVVALAALLAIPTGRRRTVRTAEPEEPGDLSFGEEDDD